jgi:mannose-6-phosphate isomerase-like protein (cupin superfamily)
MRPSPLGSPRKLRTAGESARAEEGEGKAMTERRPWGSYTILEEREAYKVKRIKVLPSKRLSYQRHQKRDEHWVIVEGEAVVTVEGKDILLSPGGSVDIPRMAAHRILNPGKSLLVFIEVQKGDYFGEDDIIRLEDDFGRGPR